MIKLMIFDLDGTLLDTIHDLAAATNRILEKHGFPTHPTEAYHYFVGNGVTKLVTRAMPEAQRTPELIHLLQTEQLAYYGEHMLDQTKPFVGIPEALAALQAKGVALAVVTNKPDAPAQKLMQDFFPNIHFMQVFGQREGVPTKPDPACVNSIVEQSGFTKEEVLYFGDSDVDMFTASNAGVTGVGVLWGYRTKEELLKAGAAVIIDKVEELLALAEK